jgi:hypothetical protein
MGVLRRIRRRAAKVDASRPLEPLSCGSPGLRLRYFQPHKAPLTRLHKTSPQYIYLPIHATATATATGAGVQKRQAPRNDLDHEQPGGKLLTIRRAHRYAWPWAVDTAAQTHCLTRMAPPRILLNWAVKQRRQRLRRQARGPSLIPSHGWS